MMRAGRFVVVVCVVCRGGRGMIAAGHARSEHGFEIAAAELQPDRHGDGKDPPAWSGQGHDNDYTRRRVQG